MARTGCGQTSSAFLCCCSKIPPELVLHAYTIKRRHTRACVPTRTHNGSWVRIRMALRLINLRKTNVVEATSPQHRHIGGRMLMLIPPNHRWIDRGGAQTIQQRDSKLHAPLATRPRPPSPLLGHIESDGDTTSIVIRGGHNLKRPRVEPEHSPPQPPPSPPPAPMPAPVVSDPFKEVISPKILQSLRSSQWARNGGTFTPMTSRLDGDPNGARCNVCSLILSYTSSQGLKNSRRHSRLHQVSSSSRLTLADNPAENTFLDHLGAQTNNVT